MLLLYVSTSCLLKKEDSRMALSRDSAFGRVNLLVPFAGGDCMGKSEPAKEDHRQRKTCLLFY